MVIFLMASQFHDSLEIQNDEYSKNGGLFVAQIKKYLQDIKDNIFLSTLASSCTSEGKR